jgi:hypothetical protein
MAQQQKNTQETEKLVEAIATVLMKQVNEALSSQNRAIEGMITRVTTPQNMEIQTKLNVLTEKVDAMAAPKKTQSIKAPVETKPGETPAAAPAKPVKVAKAAPVVDPLAKTFNNKLHYINAIAIADRVTYEKIIPAELITKARADASYIAAAKTTEPIDFEKTPADLVKRLRKIEASKVYEVIKGGGEYTAVLNALDKAMKDHKGGAAPAKIETLEAGSD